MEAPVAKLSFLAGFGAGYILGARAGRERYEQIRRAWEHAKDDPRLQGIAGMAQARAGGALSSIRAKMGNDPPRGPPPRFSPAVRRRRRRPASAAPPHAPPGRCAVRRR